MHTESTELTGSGTADARMGRRTLIGVGAGVGASAAISLLPAIATTAVASSGTDDTTTVPTTTAPPRRPTDSDIGVLAGVQMLELTARALYDTAIAAGAWSDTEATAITTIREAHEAAAQALSGLLGGDAPGEMSQSLYDSLAISFEGSIDDRLAAAYSLESSLVAGHTAALAELQGIDGATLIAAIQSAEARHGTVLADLAGQTETSTLLVLDEAAPLEVTE